MTSSNAALEMTAAQALAGLMPSPTPLTPVPGPAATMPSATAQAVVATFVGQVSAELVVVPHEDVIAALEAAGNLSLAEALRPALEAAADTLGAGVLSPAEQRNAGEVLGASGMTLIELHGDGEAQAWFGMSVRGEADPGASSGFSAGGGAAQAVQPAPAMAAAAPAAGMGGVPAAGGAPAMGGGPAPVAFPPLGEPKTLASVEAGMRVLYDVEMTLTVEIGRTRLPVRDVLDLTPGTVLELDRSAGAPADIMVNGRLVARGEIVVVDDEYAVRVSEIVSGVDGVR